MQIVRVLAFFGLVAFASLGLIDALNSGNDGGGEEKYGDDDGSEVELCDGGDGGSLWLTPVSSFLAVVDEGGNKTVFVEAVSEILFKCRQGEGEEDLAVTFSSAKASERNSNFRLEDGTGGVGRILHTNYLRNKNLANKRNVTISCGVRQAAAAPFCRVTLIAINQEPVSCSVNATVSCPVDDWVNKVSPERSPDGGFLGRSAMSGGGKGYPYQTLIKQDASPFEATITYSIFYAGEWIGCKEFDAENETVVEAEALEAHTATIQCPIVAYFRSGPVVIRLEKRQKKGISVALPNLNVDNLPPSYTYFTVYVNRTIYAEEEEEAVREAVLPIALSVVAVSLVVAVVIIVVMLWRRRNRSPCSIKSASVVVKDGVGGGHNHLVELGNVVKYPESDCTACTGISSNAAMSSLSGDGYCDLHVPNRLMMMMMDDGDGSPPPLGLYQDEHIQRLLADEVHMHDLMRDPVKLKALYKKLLARQLSGDPSKINPDLSLNHQAKALPYNPALEIDRNNFRCDKILGHGNFGCVYEGEATGLFHPSSKTKVAVKTVLNAMDMTQLDALLCEVKILTTLELHLNLVNLMGSCTSMLTDTGELWVLLEYCPHGNLKNYLFNHRSEFLNNINGLCTTDLNSRTFVRWAHHVAKGMEYLARKRIMHGDLAARNILIGGEEGRLVAKVSDFGLSKTFYDNIRYKKQKRNYVPWKWMALEYLKDGCFTITSDVWSYAVVIWEIFSLGEEPYSDKTLEDIMNGYRLPCPDQVANESSWSPRRTYDSITRNCWIADPVQRSHFGEVVRIVEAELYAEELIEYSASTNEYSSMSLLMMDNNTRLKRTTSTFNKQTATATPSYTRASHLDVMDCKDDDDEEEGPSTPPPNVAATAAPMSGYVSMESANSTFPESQQQQPVPNTQGYVTMAAVMGGVVDAATNEPIFT